MCWFSLRLYSRINPAFALEVLPNRDSLPYMEKYGIPEVSSMFRGTLRYEVRVWAWCVCGLGARGLGACGCVRSV